MGFQIPLVEIILSHSVSYVLAAAIFVLPWLLHSHKVPPTRVRIPVLPVLLSAAVGGALAGAVGYTVGYSVPVDTFMALFGWQAWLPEPALSVALIIGSGVSALMVLSIIDRPEIESPDLILGPGNISRMPALAAGSTLVGRLVAAIVGVVSVPSILIIERAPVGLLPGSVAGGALCGYLIGRACLRLRAA
jgi:hypothetical protein